MRKPGLLVAGLLAFGFAGPSSATAPGTPMDCSDLELAPGLTCTTLTTPGADFSGIGFTSSGLLDNEGRVVRRATGGFDDVLEIIGACGTRDLTHSVLLYVLSQDGSQAPLVTVRSRCLDAATGRVEHATIVQQLFDAVRGSLLIVGNSGCTDRVFAACPGYGGGAWLARIDGFTPLAEVLPPPASRCSNGIDDDGDGEIDLADLQCKATADNDEARP